MGDLCRKERKSIALGVETLEQNKIKENKIKRSGPGVCEIAEQFTEMLSLQGQIDQSRKEGM